MLAWGQVPWSVLCTQCDADLATRESGPLGAVRGWCSHGRMGLLRVLFLGDLGNWMDNEDTRTRVQRLRHRLRSAQRTKDRSQDQRLDALEHRIEQLELCLVSMTHLLVGKNALSRDEVEGVIGGIEDDGQHA